MSHTPGPWYYVTGAVYDKPFEDVGKTARCIAIRATDRDAYGGFRIDPSEKDANMRLIAAAPEMLEALKELCGAVSTGTLQQKNKAYGKAIDAIAKAEGKE